MEQLWAPWRMGYIEGHKRARPDDAGCVFCVLQETGADEDGERILARGERAFVTLAKFPYNPGHLLVLPARHTGDLEDLSAEESAEIHALIQRCLTVLRAESDPHAFNVGINLGRAAGAGIPEHLHWHVIPRWTGDTDFMTLVGQTQVLPQLLSETFARLRPRFGA